MILQRKSSALMKLGSLTLATVFAILAGCGADLRVGSIESAGEGDGPPNGTVPAGEQETPARDDADKKPKPSQCVSTAVKQCADVEPFGESFLFNCDTTEVIPFEPKNNSLPTCDEVYDACNAYAVEHRDESFGCRYADTWIYRRELKPGACSPSSSLLERGCADPCADGLYEGELCVDRIVKSSFSDPNLTCGQALEACWLGAYWNPSRNIRCTFNGTPLYFYEESGLPKVDDCL